MKLAIRRTNPPAAPAAATGYNEAQLADIVRVPLDEVRRWIAAGLRAPSADGGFDFRQLSRAQTIRDLIASGISIKKLRAQLAKLGDATPSDAISAIVGGDEGEILARLGDGELVRHDGQLQLDFPGDGDAQPMTLANPNNARDWYSRGIAFEVDIDLASAIACYREALMAGGPDAEISFALAQALAATGQHEQASERYRQVLEIDPRQPDAWNNLGVSLCELNLLNEACDAFRRALQLRPTDAGACYNLADALDELGERAQANEQWQAYLRLDRQSERAAYARRRLNAG